MDKITRAGQTLVFEKRVPPAVRVAIFLFGLFPLLAPYELLFKIRWESYFNPSFFIALLFSMVMLAASVFVVFIALFAQDHHVCFDGGRATLTHGWSDVLRAYRQTDYRFDELSAPALETHIWSDSPKTFDLLVRTRSGAKISFGDFKSREEALLYQELLAGIILRSTSPQSSPQDAPGGEAGQLVG